ncbi:hypothetical protein Anas_04696, partial [Armadillidium nasatum]
FVYFYFFSEGKTSPENRILSLKLQPGLEPPFCMCASVLDKSCDISDFLKGGNNPSVLKFCLTFKKISVLGIESFPAIGIASFNHSELRDLTKPHFHKPDTIFLLYDTQLCVFGAVLHYSNWLYCRLATAARAHL